MVDVRETDTTTSRVHEDYAPVTDRYRPFPLPPPGDDLVGLIQEHADRVPACAVWHVYELSWRIPQLTDNPLPELLVGAALPPWALEVTRTGSYFAYQHTKPRERDKLRFLAMAAQHDLLGQPESEIADEWIYARELYDAKLSSPTRAGARKGRALWRAVGAWPWCCCPPGRLPDEWWLAADVRAAFGAWTETRAARIKIEQTRVPASEAHRSEAPAAGTR